MSKNSVDNASAIAGIRRKLAIANAVLIGSLALIPLGFLCPCGFSMIIFDTSAALATVCAISSFLLPFVGLGGLLLMAGDRSRYVRALAVAQVAQSRKLKYTYEPKSSKYRLLRSFRLFTGADHERAYNLMVGKMAQLPFFALDYSHAYGSGGSAIVYYASVTVFQAGFEGLPAFVLYPRGWFDKLSDFIAGAPLKFSPSKKFNKAFVVIGDERSAIENLFTDRFVELCLSEPNLTIELRDSMLVAYCYETLLDERRYEEFLDLLQDIAHELRKDVVGQD